METLGKVAKKAEKKNHHEIKLEVNLDDFVSEQEGDIVEVSDIWNDFIFF